MGTCSGCGTNNTRLSTVTVDADPSKKSRKRSMPIHCIFTEKRTNENLSASANTQQTVPTSNWIYKVVTSIPANSDDDQHENEDEDNETMDEIKPGESLIVSDYELDNTETAADHDADRNETHDNNLTLDDPESDGNESNDNTNTLKIKTKPNLFRPRTNSEWDMSDIESLEEDMQQELKSLHLSTPTAERKELEAITFDHIQFNDSNKDSLPNVLKLEIPKNSSTNLIQTFSHDWDSDDMEIQEEEMTKHLKHLQNEYENTKLPISPFYE